MNWIHLQSLWVGIIADSLTFIGGFILTRDAFLRLSLTDDEFKAAVATVRWALAGFVLLLLGFLTQLLLRLIEAQRFWRIGGLSSNPLY
jgi:hypothetical protein